MSDEIEMLRTELAHAKEYGAEWRQKAQETLEAVHFKDSQLKEAWRQLRELQCAVDSALKDEDQISKRQNFRPASWWQKVRETLTEQLGRV